MNGHTLGRVMRINLLRTPVTGAHKDLSYGLGEGFALVDQEPLPSPHQKGTR